MRFTSAFMLTLICHLKKPKNKLVFVYVYIKCDFNQMQIWPLPLTFFFRNSDKHDKTSNVYFFS